MVENNLFTVLNEVFRLLNVITPEGRANRRRNQGWCAVVSSWGQSSTPGPFQVDGAGCRFDGGTADLYLQRRMAWKRSVQRPAAVFLWRCHIADQILIRSKWSDPLTWLVAADWPGKMWCFGEASENSNNRDRSEGGNYWFLQRGAEKPDHVKNRKKNLQFDFDIYREKKTLGLDPRIYIQVSPIQSWSVWTAAE